MKKMSLKPLIFAAWSLMVVVSVAPTKTSDADPDELSDLTWVPAESINFDEPRNLNDEFMTCLPIKKEAMPNKKIAQPGVLVQTPQEIAARQKIATQEARKKQEESAAFKKRMRRYSRLDEANPR